MSSSLPPSTQAKIDSVKKYLEGRNNDDDEIDEVYSNVMSDSFRSRSSGGGSDSDNEAAVRRTDRRESREGAAVKVQSRVRGMIGRNESYHRRAVVDRMVRKALMDEREKVIGGLKRASETSDAASLSASAVTIEKFTESEDVDSMVKKALVASGVTTANDGNNR